MNVAFFVTQFPSVSETFIVNQVVDLQAKGCQVDIYAGGRGEGIVHEKITENNLDRQVIYYTELPRTRLAKVAKLMLALMQNLSLANLGLLLRFLQEAKSQGLSVYHLIPFLGRPKYDVVHAHFGVNGNHLIRLRTAGLFSQSKFVTTFHGYDLEPSAFSFDAYEALFKRCDLFTVNSDYSRYKLVQLGCPSEKVVKMPVGFSPSEFNAERRSRTADIPVNLLFVGRLTPFKAPDLVVEICRRLKYEKGLQFQAVIVGEGELKESIVHQVEKFMLKAEVKLLSAKTQKEIKELMETADIFLFPGRTINGRAENQGLVIQEAQAMELPVVVSDAGGMKEGLIDGITGFVLPENDVDAFVEKVDLLARNPALRSEMGEAGRAFVAQKFNVRFLNGELLKLYQS